MNIISFWNPFLRFGSISYAETERVSGGHVVTWCLRLARGMIFQRTII